MASTMLQRTQSGTETDSKKATISVWVKLGSSHVGNFNAGIFGTHVSGNYGADGNTQVGFYNGGLYAWFKDGGTTYYKQESTRRFRDHNSWYHLVYRYDMTESTASNRIRVYVNGEEITSWSSTNNPGSTQNIQMNNGGRIVRVGTYNFLNGTNNDFDGCMSHYYFCDGYSYAPTEFGETDATTGIWKIKTDTNVNHGTNGFLILKDGNTITDQSANSNDFSVGSGTLTKTEDCPSNVFCTLNPLSCNGPLEDGNTTFAGVNGSTTTAKGTLGVTEGKWYFEAKVSGDYPMIGIGSMNEAIMQNPTGGGYPGGISNSYGIYGNGSVYANGSNTGNQGFTYTTNDIIGVALDLDSATKTIVWYKNGSQIATYNLTNTGSDYPFTPFAYNGGATATANFNFGNGYFGTTAVSTPGTNASGNGIFEYDVPTGYTALSTKGLNL